MKKWLSATKGASRPILVPSVKSRTKWLKISFLVFSGIVLVTSLSLFLQTTQSTASRITKSKPKNTSTGATATAPTFTTLNDYGSLIDKYKKSVVKITGIDNCDYEFAGTGFVVAPNLVATNAHVVAGTSSPQVSDGSKTYTGTTVVFQPNLDFAVLRVNGLSDKPLPLDQRSDYAVNWVGSHNGDHDVLLGYPGGGSFKAVLATITDEYDAEISNIYGGSNSSRDIYQIRAPVIPGNSGGPLVQQNGQVVGVVFAVPLSGSDQGFVLPTTDFYSAIQEAKSLYSPVSNNQACPAE